MKSYSGSWGGDFELMIASPCCRCDVVTLLNLLMSCTRAFIDILPRKMATKLQAGRAEWSGPRNLIGKHARGAVHKECMQCKMHTQEDDEDEDEACRACLGLACPDAKWAHPHRHAPKKKRLHSTFGCTQPICWDASWLAARKTALSSLQKFCSLPRCTLHVLLVLLSTSFATWADEL